MAERLIKFLLPHAADLSEQMLRGIVFYEGTVLFYPADDRSILTICSPHSITFSLKSGGYRKKEAVKQDYDNRWS